MNDPRAAMRLIGGIEPTPEQIQRVQAIAHSLGIPNNDLMMPIFIGLDCYHGIFSELPAKMQAAADTSAQAAADRSTAMVNEAVAQAVTNLGPKVGAAIVSVANDINQVDKAKWIGGVVVVVGLVFSAFGWLTHASGYSSGFDGGKAAGYEEAKNQVAAANWANTPEGQAAYKLSQKTSLAAIAQCNGGPKWYVKNGVCFPEPEFKTDNEGKKTGEYSLIGWYVVSPEAGKKNVVVLKEKSVIPAAEEKKGFFSFIGF